MCKSLNFIGKKFTLGKNERLKSRKLIEQVFEGGKGFNVFPFRVAYKVIEIYPEHLQTGFGVSSRNFKKAVTRNRIRRMMREAYRLQKQALGFKLTEKNINLALFIMYTGKELPDQELIKEKISLILQRFIKKLDENDPSNM